MCAHDNKDIKPKSPAGKGIRKILNLSIKLIIIVFALIGLYQSWTALQWKLTKDRVAAKESSRPYEKDLLYLLPNGKPVLLFDASYTRTLFFMEGFRGQAGIGIYREWLEKIHREQKVNIVGPIYGLQGWPFTQRNREWYYQEDMREILQIYDAYTASLPSGHRVIVASQSFGALGSMTIMAKAQKTPDAVILMSPLNTGLEYRSGGKLIKWLAGQRSWLHYIVPFSGRNVNPKRAGYWDIVNDRMNKDAWEKTAKDVICWEENIQKGVEVDEAAAYMENSLAPQAHQQKIAVVYGDDDLYFGRTGFQNLASKLRAAGNSVETVELPNTGHMLLLDNGAEKAKKLIIDAVNGTHLFLNR